MLLKKLLKSDLDYILANYLELTTSEMAEQIGCSKGTVQSAMKRYKVQVPKQKVIEKRQRVAAAKEAKPKPGDDIIREKYLTVNVNQLSILLNRSETYIKTRLKNLGLIIPAEIIEQRKRDSRIKPGTPPPNKGLKQTEYMTKEAIERTKATRFKKGEPNHNSLYDGAIRIHHEHPDRSGGRMIKWIRISKGKWQQLQIYNYEKLNGPVPKGYILACLSEDTLNCDLSNWELITMAENMKRNSGSLNLSDGYVVNTLAGKNAPKQIRDALSKRQDLIEAKRTFLKLKRTIKSKQHESHK